MSYEKPGAEALDYLLCRYGRSKLTFRGPQKQPRDDYIAVIGSTEVFGKYVPRPFPDLLEQRLGVEVVNLGCVNAGLDAFVTDHDILSLAGGARVTVVQVMDANAISNRLFRVHSRRNDRFLGPSPMLSAMYREVDFTDFNFTRHMLSTLQMVSADRFATVREELRTAWSARMKMLLRSLDCPTVLLWLRDEVPGLLGTEPLFVGADMVQDLADLAPVVHVSMRRGKGDLAGMVFDPLEIEAASRLADCADHERIADALVEPLQVFLG
jgi:hypothetical protein